MINSLRSFFYIDQIAIVTTFLILFVGTSVIIYSLRYMKGDKRYAIFFTQLFLLLISIGITICADNLWLCFSSLCVSNGLLVRLMIHKPSWLAAKNSGVLAAKNYSIACLAIGTAFGLLHYQSNETSIQEIIKNYSSRSILIPALITLGAMAQSAIYPFHRWLISSLNSPTPVSAVMHAGIINGGGFLLIRFSPIYSENHIVLNSIFIIGLVSSIAGTFWKLLQSDVKRMLACSTLAQMGFMFAQCGLGLFPAALAHLATHGLFKSYLFLSSGGAAQKNKEVKDATPTILNLIISVLFGIVASYIFAITSGKNWIPKDTNFVLIFTVFLMNTQISLTILSQKIRYKIPITILITSLFSLVYGCLVFFMFMFISPLQISKPQSLTFVHITGIFVLAFFWIITLYKHKAFKISALSNLLLKAYVTGLNSSQPNKSTVTSHRKLYKNI